MIWSAFVIGLLGSLHCVGMCGPLALAVPTRKGHRLSSAAVFNGGRILTYGMLGAFFGLVGMGFHLAGVQSYLSLLTGAFVIMLVIFPRIENRLNFGYHKKMSAWVRTQIAQKIGRGTYSSIFILGMLNGLLPCGLIYVAVAGALETGFVETSAIYMMLFGLGTSILLVMTMLSRDIFSKIKLFKPKRFVPYLTFAIGILFIVRGLLYMVPPEHHELAAFEILSKITMCHVPK